MFILRKSFFNKTLSILNIQTIDSLLFWNRANACPFRFKVKNVNVGGNTKIKTQYNTFKNNFFNIFAPSTITVPPRVKNPHFLSHFMSSPTHSWYLTKVFLNLTNIRHLLEHIIYESHIKFKFSNDNSSCLGVVFLSFTWTVVI